VSSGGKSTSGYPHARKQDSRGPANHVGVAWGDWVLCRARVIESNMAAGGRRCDALDALGRRRRRQYKRENRV